MKISASEIEAAAKSMTGMKHQTPLHTRLTRWQLSRAPRTFQEQKLRMRSISGGQPLCQGTSGPRSLAGGIEGPVAVESDHAPFDALAKAGKAAVLDDRVMHRAHLAVADHHLPEQKRRGILSDCQGRKAVSWIAVGGDHQRGIPEGAFLLLELRNDGRQRGFARRDTAVIARAESQKFNSSGLAACGLPGGQQPKRPSTAPSRALFRISTGRAWEVRRHPTPPDGAAKRTGGQVQRGNTWRKSVAGRTCSFHPADAL